MNANTGQFGEQRLQFGPDPLCKILTGRILQAGQVIEIVMIKSLKKWLEYSFDLTEVAYPASVGVHLPFYIQRYTE